MCLFLVMRSSRWGYPSDGYAATSPFKGGLVFAERGGLYLFHLYILLYFNSGCAHAARALSFVGCDKRKQKHAFG